MSSLKGILKNLGGKIMENSPALLTGLGCIGVISTAVLAATATPKAIRLLEEYNEREKEDEENTIKESFNKFKIAAPEYIPTVISAAASIVCIIGAHKVNVRKQAALAMLYSLSETTLKEYQNKVLEQFGKGKELKVRDSINSDAVKKNPPGKNEIIFTGNGEVTCYDKLSGRYFKSSHEKIRQVIDECNRRLRSEDWLSLNEVYYEFGLSDIELGNMVGFNIDKGYIEPTYSCCLDEERNPCLVIELEVNYRF